MSPNQATKSRKKCLMFILEPVLFKFQEKEEVYNRMMNLEQLDSKRSVQIKELTLLLLTIRDEVNHKHSGFFSKKKSDVPLPPELDLLIPKLVTLN